VLVPVEARVDLILGQQRNVVNHYLNGPGPQKRYSHTDQGKQEGKKHANLSSKNVLQQTRQNPHGT
jgi:hypothetical protein